MNTIYSTSSSELHALATSYSQLTSIQKLIKSNSATKKRSSSPDTTASSISSDTMPNEPEENVEKPSILSHTRKKSLSDRTIKSLKIDAEGFVVIDDGKVIKGLSNDRIITEIIENRKPILLKDRLNLTPLKRPEICCDSDVEAVARDIILEIIDFDLPTISNIALNRKRKPWVDPPVYFTPAEVALHNRPKDCWVSYLGHVYNLTQLVVKYFDRPEIRPILAFAGKDISDWFDDNGEIRHYIHPIMGIHVPYLPHGPLPDVQPFVPTSAWTPMETLPWWRDYKRYRIGILTEKARPIRIINILTGDECTLNVCKEDTLFRILERLGIFHGHGANYTWKFEGRVLDMGKTLENNGIPDERDEYVEHFLPESLYTPALCLYFNDDLMWDEDSDGTIDI